MPPKISEPISTISAVLTMKQIVWLNDEAERRGLKRTVVLREVVERGIEAQAQDSDAKEAQEQEAA